MNFTKFCKTSALVITFLGGAAVYSSYSNTSETACLKVIDSQNAAACAVTEQQSWYSWLRGKSRSAQFHFVDLLELLNRLSPTK